MINDVIRRFLNLINYFVVIDQNWVDFHAFDLFSFLNVHAQAETYHEEDNNKYTQEYPCNRTLLCL